MIALFDATENEAPGLDEMIMGLPTYIFFPKNVETVYEGLIYES